MSKHVSIAVFCLSLVTGQLGAWDIPGHMMVAQVAYTRLNTNAAAHLAKLGAQLELKGHHYNAVNIAGWADDIKHASGVPEAGHFKEWHFIDLGCPDSHFELLTNPPALALVNGDVVSALKHCVAVVKGHPDPLIVNEAVAVALIVHLAGDIHQPLHCSSHYYEHAHVEPGHRRTKAAESDAGGNAIAISNFSDKYPELHEFWDKAYKASRPFLGSTITTEKDLETFQTSPNDPAITKAVQAVLVCAPPASANLKPDFEAWARETHELGCSEAYGKLSAGIETSPQSLSYKYVKNAHKVAQAQLCLAGYRLAELLNELYPAH